MASIIKVDTIQDTDGNNIINENANTITIGASGDTISIPSGATLANSGTATGFGISWQSAIKTSSFTAVAGEGYWINTTSTAITVTLPASASVGDTIEFTDYARTWATNNLTLNPNSLNYQGNSSPNPVYDVNGQHVRIVYSGATQGWIPTVDDDVTLETPQSITTDFLVIAGGGAGGQDTGGGGGAGGYRTSYSTDPSGGGASSETALELLPGTVYTITVGGGASANPGSPSRVGGTGSDSSISGSDITDITCAGGGGAGGGGGSPGQPGGSGGGGGDSTGPAGSGTANQGFNGQAGGPGFAGAGGGAGEVGGTDGDGHGGDGLASSITGSSVTRGGGGAGCDYPATNTPGGDGGGGNTTNPTGNGGNGTANTGSGGGGGALSAPRDGGAGGSGIVILRLPTSEYSGTTSGSPTVTTDGSDTIIKFTGNGTYTA